MPSTTEDTVLLCRECGKPVQIGRFYYHDLYADHITQTCYECYEDAIIKKRIMAVQKKDDHDDHPHVGQCCNYASRGAYGDCRYCGRLCIPNLQKWQRDTLQRLGVS